MILDGIVISERTKIFVPDRDLKLKGGTIRKKVACEDGAFKVTLSSPTFCRSVMVDIEGLRTPFSDNYFDLLPNEEKVITVEAKKAYTADDVKVKSLADVPVKKSKLRSTLYRAEFAAEPGNVANWIVYTVIQFIT